MEASSFLMPLVSACPQIPCRNISANPRLTHLFRGRGWFNRRINLIRAPPTRAIDGGTASNLAPVEISWQIAVGALAGAAPFVVAGIEFGKRIVAQRRCGTCGGSGLVRRDECYFRCPTCGRNKKHQVEQSDVTCTVFALYNFHLYRLLGGFLPWQSWKRFFTG